VNTYLITLNAVFTTSNPPIYLTLESNNNVIYNDVIITSPFVWSTTNVVKDLQVSIADGNADEPDTQNLVFTFQ